MSTRVQRRFRDKVTIGLESHVARLQASVSTIAHQERPELIDRLSVLRDQVFVLDHMYMSVFSTAGWILRLGVTVVLLASISPVLVLLVLFAVPTVATSSWRPAVERETEEAGAPSRRLAEHLFTTATTAAPAKEVRVTGIAPRLQHDRREAWEGWYGPVARTRLASAVWHTLGWAVFGAGYVAAIVYVSSGLDAPAPDVLLVLAAGSRLSAYIAADGGRDRLPPGHLDGRVPPPGLAGGLRRRPRRRRRRGRCPTGSSEGIVLDHVELRLPGHRQGGPRRRAA